jgi:RNA polymerase sigma-70 factor, ECF subfamily
MAGGQASQDDRYRIAAAAFGAALERLARAYEADADLRRDLVQDIHFALWRSFALYDERCALRSWVYRVAHNVGASHVLQQRRSRPARAVSFDELVEFADGRDPEQEAGEQRALVRLMALIRGLKSPDQQVMLLYLEDLDAAAIGEVTGLSPGAVAAKIHRAKLVLARHFQAGGRDAD